jgi:glycosyltransferase involved in cell wall biosynthesis
LATRWKWAKKHGSVPILYYLFDLARITKSVLFRKQDISRAPEAGHRLIIFQRLFSHYRKSFYDGLMKGCDFVLLHGTDNSGIRNESAAYARLTRQVSIPLTNLKFYFSKYLHDESANVVVLDFAVQVLNLPFWMWKFRRKKKKVFLWSHGYNRRRGFHPGKSLIDRYRRLLINYSDGLIVYSQSDKDYLVSKGIVCPVYVLRATLDSEAIWRVKKHYLNNGAAHGNGQFFKYNLTFIGRMNREKNPRGLIKMFDTFTRDFKDQVAVHFIGDGPETAACHNALANHPFRDHFIFHGELYDEAAVGKIMLASDLVIILGEVGLSVNHALLYGIPVVTFTRDMNGPFHGPEKEHIIHGKTGFWILKNDYLQLARVVQHYLADKDLQAEMRQAIREYANVNLKLEHMIGTFSNVISATATPVS